MNRSIEANLKEVHRRIEAACSRCGRSPEEITLIAVSKTWPLEELQEAYRCGERIFVENPVPASLAQAPAILPDARFYRFGNF